MKTIVYSALALISAAGAADAATVSFSPASNAAGVNSAFTVNIVGSFALEETIEGGGLNLAFDPAILKVTGVTINTALFDFYSDPGTIDNTAGEVSDIVFNTFAGADGDFIIATIGLMSLAEGNSPLQLTESSLNPFSSASAGDQLSVTFVAGDVAVTAVPVPAAAWLMVSGLTLIGFAGRRTSRA